MTWFSFSCFTACNRSTSRTFYVPIFLSLHNSFRLPFLPVCLAMPVTPQGLSLRPPYSTSHTPLSWQRHFYRSFFLTLSFGFLSVVVSHILAMRILQTPDLQTAPSTSGQLSTTAYCLFGRFSADFNVLCQLRILHSFASNVVLGERFWALLLHSTLQNISQRKLCFLRYFYLLTGHKPHLQFICSNVSLHSHRRSAGLSGLLFLPPIPGKHFPHRY